MKNLLVILLTLFVSNLYSQTDITRDTVLLDSVVLTGIRAGTKTPVTAKTITGEQLRIAYSGQELPVLLNQTPSITSYTDAGTPQGYTYFRLRGIDQTRINMTLNGVPLNEPEDQGVYFSNYPNFIKNVKSLQIQRGVGTSSNGISSFAGSINFTSPFGLTKKTELEMEYGSFGTYRSNLTIQTGLSKNKKWSAFLNLSGFNTDGYRYHSGSAGLSGFVGIAYYGDDETLKLSGFSGGSYNEMAWFGVAEADIKSDPRINYNNEMAYDLFKQSLVMLEYKKYFSTLSNVSMTVFYNRLDGQWDLYDGDRLRFGLASNFMGLVSNFNYTPNDLDINIGFGTNHYNREHRLDIRIDELYKNTGYKNEISSYGKIEWNKDLFTLFTDLQLRHSIFKYDGDTNLDYKDWTFFNPKFGLTYDLTDNSKLYGSIGTANREPTRSDMFGGQDNLLEFTIVAPEKVIDYEAGFHFKNENFKLASNFFYMGFQNEITLLGALGEDSLPLFGNVEKSYRAGIELDGNYKLTDNLSLSYNGTFSKNNIRDNGNSFEPLYTPRVVQNISFGYTIKDIFIGASAKNHSSSYLDFENEYSVNGFTTINAVVKYDYDKFQFKIQGMNLSNIDYYTNGYVVGNEKHLYVNAPISVYGTITYKF